jgi:septal ring factor EnvC (AmiA/AmiB activator)
MSTDRLTEVLNYLSAISRDIGEFRAEVNARFDGLETRVGRLETEVRGILTRFDRLESRVLEIRADTRDLDDRVSALEGKPHADRL